MRTLRPRHAAAIGAVALGLLLGGCRAGAQTSSDPLPSWNDTAHKRQIMSFVERTTEGPDAIPEIDRIAVIDNDGTLWAEQPIYFQFEFAAARIRALAPQHPEWATTEPYKSLLEGDMMSALASEVSLMQVIDATHSGMSVEEFNTLVQDWFRTARHPRFNRPYTEMVYQPMLEMMDYLRDNGYRVYIVSGGGVDFLRAFAEQIYGVPPEMVVGSLGKVEYVVTDGVPALIKRPGVDFIDDKDGKAVAIHRKLGKRPIIAFGNSDGDFPMLEWTTAGADGPRLGAYIHHTDAERDWAYDRDSRIGRLSRGLDAAPAQGWIIVDTKDDWKYIFPFDRPGH